MQTLQKFRRYELGFIISAVTIYVIRQLLWLKNDFESDIRMAKWSKVPIKTILDDLAIYDHNLNSIFPTIAAAVLFTAAWYVFHYLAIPRLKTTNSTDYQTITYIILTALLVLGSVFIYNYFKLYWRVRLGNTNNIIGLKVNSEYRKLYVLTNTYAGIMVIVFYEVITQIYYFTQQLYSQKKEEKVNILSNFILISTIISIIFWTFFGRIAAVVIGGAGALGTLFIIFSFFLSHQLFFNYAIPYYKKRVLNSFDGILNIILGFFALFGSAIVFSIFLERIYPRGGAINLFAFYILPVSVGLITALIRWIFFVENLQLKTTVSNKEAELSNLRSQINPHFLFNALNTLYSVSLKENAEKTSDGIQKLGDMMRFMLNENHQDRIPLSKEIEYLNNYIDIQRMRIDESQNIEIKVNIQSSEREIFIAPMLLNPFVENAFKHGISFRNPSWIYITLTHDAQKLYFKVHNSLHPKNENDLESESNGIGLENVKKRLELIYPNRYTLDIQASDNDYFVSLILGIY